MRFMGIDQSLTGTGICVLDDKGKIIISKTLEKEKVPHSTEEEILRLQKILKDILKVIKQAKPDLIAMEDYGFSTKGRAFKLGELGGIIRLALFERGKCPIIFHSRQLKQFLTGKGNADKNLILLNVYKKYKIECNDDNEADAVNVAFLLKAKYDVKNGLKSRKDFNKNEWIILEKVCNNDGMDN